jgi:flagellin
LGKTATTTSTSNVVVTQSLSGSSSAADAGYLAINGQYVGASTGLDGVSTVSADGSALAKTAALNAAYGKTGVTATVVAATYSAANVSALPGTATAVGDTFTINGVQIFGGAGNTITVQANDADGALRNKINTYSHLTGVVATLSGANIILTAADGRNINTVGVGATLLARTGLAVANTTTGGKVMLSSTSDFVITSTTANVIGFAAGAVAVTQNAATALSLVDVTTAAGAATAIQSLDSALAQVNTGRAQLGALTNRLENTITNLQTTIENLSASESRIRDADFAVETANLTRAQILQQAGVAVLSQANVSPQAALALLGK